MNEPRVVWGEDGFASKDGWALAYCINYLTSEFILAQDVWVSIGTSLPAGAFLDAPPPAEEGKAIIRQNGVWVHVDDFRGTTAYNKQTKQSEVIGTLGPVPYELTLIPPTSQFDIWNEGSGSWIKDAQAEQDWLTQQATYQRSYLLNEASNEIAALLDALDPAIISDPNDAVQVKLLEWKQYRAALAVIDCAIHPVQWPLKPF